MSPQLAFFFFNVLSLNGALNLSRFGDFIIDGLCKQALSQNVHSQICNPHDFKCSPSSSYARVVVINRYRSRRVLNMDDVVAMVADEYQAAFDGVIDAAREGPVVEVVALETHPLVEVVCKLKNARLVIAMHGAVLELAYFMSPGSGLIEMFPYALNPNNYMPYRSASRHLCFIHRLQMPNLVFNP
jgi:hypothetical protein